MPALQAPPQTAPYQEILSTTASLLLQESDPDTLCQAVFNILRGPFEVDAYFHYLVAKEGTHMELASCGGNEAARAILGSRLEFGQAICGVVANSCESMYVTGIQRRTDDMTSIVRGFGVRTYACHPLILRGQLIGTISFGSSTRTRFTPEEIELFRVIALQITIATDRRRQSDQLLQMKQLAAAGRMSATLAHEINNPLETLSNLLYLLRNEVAGTDGEAFVDKAESQVAQLADTARRTLNQFRGRQQQLDPTNLSQLVDDVLTDIRLPEHTSVLPTVEPNICVTAIPGELRQVLYNLLLNAAQFSPRSRPVSLSLRTVARHAELRVRDEGVGISEDTRANLFQPFYTTRKSGGTGIGLWLSREMIERAGGTLTFESNPALRPGTEFIATLPLAS